MKLGFLRTLYDGYFSSHAYTLDYGLGLGLAMSSFELPPHLLFSIESTGVDHPIEAHAQEPFAHDFPNLESYRPDVKFVYSWGEYEEMFQKVVGSLCRIYTSGGKIE